MKLYEETVHRWSHDAEHYSESKPSQSDNSQCGKLCGLLNKVYSKFTDANCASTLSSTLGTTTRPQHSNITDHPQKHRDNVPTALLCFEAVRQPTTNNDCSTSTRNTGHQAPQLSLRLRDSTTATADRHRAIGRSLDEQCKNRGHLPGHHENYWTLGEYQHALRQHIVSVEGAALGGLCGQVYRKCRSTIKWVNLASGKRASMHPSQDDAGGSSRLHWGMATEPHRCNGRRDASPTKGRSGELDVQQQREDKNSKEFSLQRQAASPQLRRLLSIPPPPVPSIPFDWFSKLCSVWWFEAESFDFSSARNFLRRMLPWNVDLRSGASQPAETSSSMQTCSFRSSLILSDDFVCWFSSHRCSAETWIVDWEHGWSFVEKTVLRMEIWQ